MKNPAHSLPKENISSSIIEEPEVTPRLARFFQVIMIMSKNSNTGWEITVFKSVLITVHVFTVGLCGVFYAP